MKSGIVLFTIYIYLSFNLGYSFNFNFGENLSVSLCKNSLLPGKIEKCEFINFNKTNNFNNLVSRSNTTSLVFNIKEEIFESYVCDFFLKYGKNKNRINDCEDLLEICSDYIPDKIKTKNRNSLKTIEKIENKNKLNRIFKSIISFLNKFKQLKSKFKVLIINTTKQLFDLSYYSLDKFVSNGSFPELNIFDLILFQIGNNRFIYKIKNNKIESSKTHLNNKMANKINYNKNNNSMYKSSLINRCAYTKTLEQIKIKSNKCLYYNSLFNFYSKNHKKHHNFPNYHNAVVFVKLGKKDKSKILIEFKNKQIKKCRQNKTIKHDLKNKHNKIGSKIIYDSANFLEINSDDKKPSGKPAKSNSKGSSKRKSKKKKKNKNEDYDDLEDSDNTDIQNVITKKEFYYDPDEVFLYNKKQYKDKELYLSNTLYERVRSDKNKIEVPLFEKSYSNLYNKKEDEDLGEDINFVRLNK